MGMAFFIYFKAHWSVEATPRLQGEPLLCYQICPRLGARDICSLNTAETTVIVSPVCIMLTISPLAPAWMQMIIVY